MAGRIAKTQFVARRRRRHKFVEERRPRERLEARLGGRRFSVQKGVVDFRCGVATQELNTVGVHAKYQAQSTALGVLAMEYLSTEARLEASPSFAVSACLCFESGAAVLRVVWPPFLPVTTSAPGRSAQRQPRAIRPAPQARPLGRTHRFESRWAVPRTRRAHAPRVMCVCSTRLPPPSRPSGDPPWSPSCRTSAIWSTTCLHSHTAAQRPKGQQPAIAAIVSINPQQGSASPWE